MKKVPVVKIATPDAGAKLAGLPLEATVAMADVAAAMREGLLAFSAAARAGRDAADAHRGAGLDPRPEARQGGRRAGRELAWHDDRSGRARLAEGDRHPAAWPVRRRRRGGTGDLGDVRLGG